MVSSYRAVDGRRVHLQRYGRSDAVLDNVFAGEIMIPSRLTGLMIRTWRDKKGLSQVELAEELGISEGSLLNYERESRPDKKEPVQIPRLLDWALAALAAGLRPFSERKR